MFPPAGLYKISSSIGSPLCNFHLINKLNLFNSSAVRLSGFFLNIDKLARIIAGWKIALGGIDVFWTECIERLESWAFIGSTEIGSSFVVESIGSSGMSDKDSWTHTVNLGFFTQFELARFDFSDGSDKVEIWLLSSSFVFPVFCSTSRIVPSSIIFWIFKVLSSRREAAGISELFVDLLRLSRRRNWEN